MASTVFVATLVLNFYCNVIVDGFSFQGQFGSTAPATKRTALSMSSALIIQNKGGGHESWATNLQRLFNRTKKLRPLRFSKMMLAIQIQSHLSPMLQIFLMLR